MRPFLKQFLLGRELVLAPKTHDLERHFLERFAGFCQERGLTLQELNREQLAAYRRQLLCRSSSFQAKAIRVARRFCVWAHRADYLLEDLSAFPVPKYRETLPRVPSVAEMRSLLSVPDTTTAVGLRNRLVLELFYVLGLRLGECHRLDLDHLYLKERTLRVRGKGDHERLLPISPKLFEVCLDYLDRSRPRLAEKTVEPALLLSVLGRRLSRVSLSLVVRAAGDAIGLKVHPHLLRHACATHLAEAGLDYRKVQEFLGHVRLSSTYRYTRISPGELRREFFRCHPRARHPQEEEP